MRKIKVHIQEKDKGPKELTLLNLRDEVVNFLYKDTVARSTKADLHFYILVFFASIPVGEQSLLEKVLDEAIPKFERLNRYFAEKKSYLQAREYRRMVDEYGLSDLFQGDMFFVLAEAILNFDQIEQRFATFYSQNEELARVMNTVKLKYSDQLKASFDIFQASKIQDDRYDDQGNYHDLSKSVYRTVRMRNSRNLDLNLQKYTKVEKLTSESPLHIWFIQNVDPQIIFDLWTKYRVSFYMRSLWDATSENTVIKNAAGTVLGGLVLRYARWKRTNGATNRKEKREAKEDFEVEKSRSGAALDDLTIRLVDSVLKSNERLADEVKLVRKQLSKEQDERKVKDEDEIKRLKERLEQLENLIVDASLVDGERNPNNPN